jgi:hypothetical protein
MDSSDWPLWKTVDAVGVRWSDRPDVGDGAVAQDDVGLPLAGVTRRERVVVHGHHRATTRDPSGHTPGTPGTLGSWSYATQCCGGGWCAGSTRPSRSQMEVVRDLVALAVRAPSAGFSQGWDFVALLNTA